MALVVSRYFANVVCVLLIDVSNLSDLRVVCARACDLGLSCQLLNFCSRCDQVFVECNFVFVLMILLGRV